MSIETELIDKIVNEGFKRVGKISIESALMDRAKTVWMDEIKRDIMLRAPKLGLLMNTAVTIIDRGKTRVGCPADYGSIISLDLLDYSDYNLLGSFVTDQDYFLKDSKDNYTDNYLGKSVLLRGGEATGLMATILRRESERVYITPPINFTGLCRYVYIDYHYYVEVKHFGFYGMLKRDYYGKPYYLFPIYTDGQPEFILDCYPAKDYGLKMSYYSDLLKLDNLSTKMHEIRKQWLPLWISGIMYRAAQELNDDRELNYYTLYNNYLDQLSNQGSYGSDMTNIECVIADIK